MQQPRLRVLSLALLLVWGGTTMLHAQGKLEIVGGTTYDWGTVDPGSLTATVELKNAGTGSLSILEVRRTCLCTVPSKLEKTTLSPGESTPLSIQLDVASQNGLVTRRILIRTIDSTLGTAAREDTTWLDLRAMVKRVVNVEPALSVIVGNAKIGEEVRALPLRVTNQGDDPVTIWPPFTEEGASATIRFEMFQGTTEIKGEKVLQPGEQIELRPYATALRGGALTGRVIMKTSSGKLPVVTLGIVGTVAEPAPAKEANGSAH